MYTHTIVIRYDDTSGPEIHALYPKEGLSEENALKLAIKLFGVLSEHSDGTIKYIDCPFPDYKCTYISLMLKNPYSEDVRLRTHGTPAVVALLLRDIDYEKMVEQHSLNQNILLQEIGSLKSVKELGRDEFLRKVSAFDTPVPLHDAMNALILERKAIEAEEKYKKLVERAPVFVSITQGSKFKFVNLRFAQTLGYTVEEMTSPGFSTDDIVTPEEREMIRKRSQRREAGMDEIEQYETTLLTKDGRKIHVIVNATTIEYEGQLAIQGVLTDVTERKRMEDEIKRLNESLVRESVYGIWAVSPEDRTIHVNPALEEMLGYPLEEMKDRKVTEFLAPESIDLYLDIIDSRYEDEVKSSNYKLHFLRKDGTRVSCSVGGSLLKDVDGNILGTLGILQEISEQEEDSPHD